MIYGVDVSNWQGRFDWAAYDISFAFAKATEGTGFADGQFARNWSRMRARGLVRGAYHFGHPRNSATAEADYFLAHVRPHGLHDGDLLALDLEVNDGRSAAHVASWARAWCRRVHEKSGVRPVVYTFISFARGGYCAGLGGYPLWIAAPSYRAGHPPMPLGPWSSWAIHQYSDSPIDKDVSHLTAAQLRALGGAEEDDMAERISVSASRDITIDADGAWHNLTFDRVHQDTGGARDQEGDLPGVVDHHAWATLTMDGVITNATPLARTAQVRFAKRDMTTDDPAGGYTWREIIGTEGGTPIGHTRAGMWVGEHEHLYAQVKNLTTTALVLSGATVQGTWKKL